MTLRVFSYGGGVQSTAVLCLAADRLVNYDAFLFCNVGEDSENPATLAYFSDFAVPFARENGLNLIELPRTMRDGSTRTLLEEVDRFPRSIPLPVRLAGGGFGNRSCTKRFKIEVVARWTKKHGATADDRAAVGIGFSTDEYQRASTTERVAHQVTEYPLIPLGINRRECEQAIAEHGLPPAPKSACYFCPFHSTEDWRRQARDTPDLFAKSVALEQRLIDRRHDLGLDAAYFSSTMRPLPAVLDQGDLFAESEVTCDAASCFT